MRKNKRTVTREISPQYNCRLVRDNNFGNLLFGCPPEIVKSFYQMEETIPSNIIIPQRIFRKGRNIFDLEFVTYSFIFSQQSKRILNIVCGESQEQQVKAILQEALFGPVLKEIFASFLFYPLKKFCFKKLQRVSFRNFVEQAGTDHDLFSQFKELMSEQLENEEVILRMRPILRTYFEKLPWLKSFAKNRIYRIITEAYVKAAMLKHEMNFFSLCDEPQYNEFIDSVMRFHLFDESGKVTLTNPEGLKLKIWQTRHGLFKLYRKGKLCETVDLSKSEQPQDLWQVEKAPFEMPELGITFLGTGTGFDPGTLTSCCLIWIGGKAIGVDPLANCEEHFIRQGITSSDISHIFLSHLHADHDAGLMEKILWGEKVFLLSSRVIFDSFLRKIEALTNIKQNYIKELVYFINLEPGKEISIPGINRTFITFDYAFHSIPSGRFKLRYKSLQGKEIKIGFSGDTKFDKKLVNKLHKDGIITAKRRDEIKGFLWDCDVIIHEAGGGVLHTDVQELKKLPGKIKRKMFLNHADMKIRRTKGFHFAKEGETINIIKRQHPPSVQDYLPLIRNTGLFSKLTSGQFEYLLKQFSLETFSKGQYVFNQGDIGNKFYIVLSGFAETVKDNKVVSIYEKGGFFGELALINRDRKRRADIRAKSKLQLLSLKRNLYHKFRLTTNIRERLYDFSNFFSESAQSTLFGFISQGEFIIFMEGDDIIKIGETSKDVYILLSGNVDVLDCREKLIAQLKSVEIFGEMAFLKETPRTATIRVTSKEATTICLNCNLFTEINEKFPSFYATVVKKLERRLKMLEDRE